MFNEFKHSMFFAFFQDLVLLLGGIILVIVGIKFNFVALIILGVIVGLIGAWNFWLDYENVK